MNRKFGALSIIVIIIAILLLVCTKTDLLLKTDLFVSGEGDEKIENVIDAIENGQRIIFMGRTNHVDLNHVVDVVFDNPETFWIDMQYNALSVGDISFLAVRQKYDDIDLKQQEIDNVVNRVISMLDDNMSEYDKTLFIHDWLCNHITYEEMDNFSDQDIYGALVLGRARCAGYAKAFSYILNKIGIESEVLSGDSLDKTGTNVPHAWNIVYIDNEPYYFDITWNDDEEMKVYDWFGVTSEDFRKSHFLSVGYEWEDATSTDACYYIKNNMYIDTYTPAKLASQFVLQGQFISIKCKDHDVLSDVIKALENQEEIQDILLVSGFRNVNAVGYQANENSNCIHIEVN